MKQKFKDLIKEVDIRNTSGEDLALFGVSITKEFIKSVANIIGTDLTKYKVVKKNQFVCSLMQVSRDEKIPIALWSNNESIIVSPAYKVFEVVDTNVVLPEYLALWFKREEFDREASYYGVGGVRGSLEWEDFCAMAAPVPSLEEQRKIVSEYEIIENRITIKRQINDNLEATLTAEFRKLFLSGTTSESVLLGDIIQFGNGKSRPKISGSYPVYGGNGILDYVDTYNAENIVAIGRVGAYCGSVYIETQKCWISDNAISAKSKLCEYEYYDYFLLKLLNLFNYHVGTGQQLLTQEILNRIIIPKPNIDDITRFNQVANQLFKTILANDVEIKRLIELKGIVLSRLSQLSH